jgi:WD40 repeat protein
LRGWEWRYLWQQCQPNEFAAFKDGEGWSIAFSPGGKFLLYSAPGPNRTVVREVKSSHVVTNLQPYAATLSFSPAAGLLAIGGLTNVGIWNLETWQIVQSLPGVTFPAKFSPDGRWLVTWGTNQFQLWDTETWRILQVCPGEVRDLLLERNSVAFSPNSGLLATPDNFGSFKLWKVPSLEPVPGFTEAKHRLTDGTDMVISTAFSANNKDLLVGWKDGTLQVWDLDQSKLVRSEKAHTSFISAIAVASDGSILATASNDSTLRLWDAATYKPLACLRGELGLIWSTDLSADRKTIASTGLFGTKLWKADLHQSVDLMTNAMVINGFLPTSDTLVATVKNGVILWNYATNSITEIRVPGIELDPYYFFSRSVGLKRNEASAAVGKTNGIIEIWDLSTRTPQTHWQAHSNRIFSVAFGANDTQLATGSESGEVKVWNVATHQLAGEFRPFEQRIFCVTFSPDGQMLAASGRTNKVWIANLEGKREPMRLHVGGWITGVVFSPNGELLAAHTFAEHAIYLWEVHTGTLRTILRGSDHAFDLGFTPDGETLAVGANDGLVTLWHTATQQQLIRIPVDGWFNKLCFSPDGQILAVGSGKGIRLWRMPSLKWIDSQVNKQVGGK